MMLSAVAITLFLRIDQVMIGTLAGSGEVGLYAAIVPFVEVWHVIPTAFATSLMPVFAQFLAASEDRFEQRLRQFMRSMVLVGFLIAVSVSLLAGPLVGFLLGPSFERSVPVLAILVWTNVFVFLGVAENQWIVAKNKGMLRLYKTAIGATASVLANFILIPRFGAMGSALAALVAHFFMVIVCNGLFARDLLVLQARALLTLR
jgi:PST family polysaccharide transporter